MPIFNARNRSRAMSIVGDSSDVLHFLNPDGSSKYVDASVAIKNSDIYSLIYQLSADLADGKFVAQSTRTQGMLDNPTLTANAHAFWQSMFAQLLLGGECFAYRWRNDNGTDMQWEYLRPSQVQPFLLEDGSGLIYNVSFDEPSIGLVEAIPQSDMIHIRLMSQNGGKTGVSPLASLANELAIRDASNKLTLTALGRSIMAPGILTVEKGGLLTAKMKAARSKQFMNQMNDSNSGPIVLDDLESYKPLEIQGNVAQLLNQANWTGAQIAKAYGVSDSLINGQGDQQSSIDMMNANYLQSLSRFSRSIVGELENKLAGKISLDLRPVIDPTGDSYANQLASLQKNGALAGNQVSWMLQQAGYLPDDLPDADKPKQQVQQVQVVHPDSDDNQSAEGGDDDEDDQSER